MNMNKKSIGILAGVVVLVCVAVFGGIYATRNLGKSEKVISKENAAKRLEKMVNEIDQRQASRSSRPLSTTMTMTRRRNCRILTPVR